MKIKRIIAVLALLLFVTGCTATTQQIQKEMQPLVNRVNTLENRVDTLEKKLADMETVQESQHQSQQQSDNVARRFEQRQQKGM